MMKALTRSLVVILVIVFTIWGIREVRRADCICSILTKKEAIYPISEHLYSVWEADMEQVGTFSFISTTCEHGVKVNLRIFYADGYMIGCIVQ